MSSNFQPPRHWIGPEELSADYWLDPKVNEKRGQEFFEKPVESFVEDLKNDSEGFARRDFLTLMGASMAMASFACVRRPVHKIIPYVIKPEEITSGVANYYATVCPITGAGLLAKVREGRPIKLEGNPSHPLSQGALSAVSQALILDLYDTDRATTPRIESRGTSRSKEATWEGIDEAVLAKLKNKGQKIRLLSKSQVGPATTQIIQDVFGDYSNFKWVRAPQLATEDLAQGNFESYGAQGIPLYRFDRARVVLSVGGDFLGTWPQSARYARDWAKGRKLNSADAKNASMSNLWVFESMLSVTGANADTRFPVQPGEDLVLLAKVALKVAKLRGASIPQALNSYAQASLPAVVKESDLETIAKLLVDHAGESLVIAGGPGTRHEQASAVHALVGLLNSILGNETKTVDFSRSLETVGDRVSTVYSLIQEMRSGNVDVLICWGCNPAYELPSSFGFAEAMGPVNYTVVVADRVNETAKLADVLLAESHALESWGDSEVAQGVYSIQQPTAAPLHLTRSFGEIVLKWGQGMQTKRGGFAALEEGEGWYEYVRNFVKSGALKNRGKFEEQWENLLRQGWVETDVRGQSRSFKTSALAAIPEASKTAATGIHLVSYTKISMGEGAMANNPWLQEMPDPITTATWDNYVCLSPDTAKSLSVVSDDVVEIRSLETGAKLDLPVVVLPGVAKNVAAVAMGYGRTSVGRIGDGVGKDIKDFYSLKGGHLICSGQSVVIQKTGRRYQVAVTQWHSARENRPIFNDITLSEFKKDPTTANHVDPHLRLKEVPTMWPKYHYPGYRWGMSIDMNACTGCGACIIACQAENNTPVVGRDNVRKSREMHWMRIDRYFSGNPENPTVAFQPMFCQHCENAPCETVCPVLATVHDDEGLNSQIYNRCVGTRYCQNNCPYKVRRFNFFDHWKSYEGTMNLAWNPDVTVRSRGIMEKCTFCVQRIRDGKDRAKDEGRKVRDKEILTACQQTCPTEAISFGNLHDANSEVVAWGQQKHAFRVLEVLNTVPSVSYLSKVRNKESEAHG